MKKGIVLWDSSKPSKFSMSDILLDGFVLFKQEDENSVCEMIVYLKGVPDGLHGFHIHEKGFENVELCQEAEDCCSQLGGHFSVHPRWSLDNLHGAKHGYHEGDLDFNVMSENGIVKYKSSFKNISLYEGDNCIMNRSVVLHEEEDDMSNINYDDDNKNIEKYITGNAGKRLACGEIRPIEIF